MAGILPNQLSFQINYYHVIVKSCLNHVHKFFTVQVGPYRRAISPLHTAPSLHILGRFANASLRVSPNQGFWIMPGAGMNAQVSGE